MGHYVHLNVCFACDTNDAVAELAKQHMPPEDGNREARWFLQALAERTGANPGPKGGLSTWGIVGNYTDEDEFVETLRPFWKALLSDVDGGPVRLSTYWCSWSTSRPNAQRPSKFS